MKRKIIRALDKYEDLPPFNRLLMGATTRREEGITQGAFIAWFLKQDGNEKCDYQKVDKCINDCVEDDYIKKDMVDGKTVVKDVIEDEFAFPVVIKKKRFTPQIENIYVGSKGRDLLKTYYFLPMVIGKMSMKEVMFFAFTTATMLILGYLGIQSL